MQSRFCGMDIVACSFGHLMCGRVLIICAAGKGLHPRVGGISTYNVPRPLEPLLNIYDQGRDRSSCQVQAQWLRAWPAALAKEPSPELPDVSIHSTLYTYTIYIYIYMCLSVLHIYIYTRIYRLACIIYVYTNYE